MINYGIALDDFNGYIAIKIKSTVYVKPKRVLCQLLWHSRSTDNNNVKMCY